MPVTTYMSNTGGLNLSDSPITMKDNQATGQSYNYDYLKIGALSKVLASNVLNAIADTQLTSFGIGMHHSVSTDARTAVKAAGTKLQTVDTSTGISTNLTDDTSLANSDFLSVANTQPVVFTPFNNTDGGTKLWMAGGGMSAIQGYTGTNITQNGTPVPTGSIVPVVHTSGGGTFVATGTYFYGIQFRKSGTQALSNVALDVSATVANLDDSVELPFALVTNIDTTRYDQIIVWRSVVSGLTGFTTGSVIARLSISATSYTDTGTSIADAQNVPRAGNTILDNSVLPTQTYKYITSFKRRLFTCYNSTIVASDLNKDESWPTVNTITLPSAGPITGLGTIGVPSEYTTGADEYLCIFKENELWVLTGSSLSDWAILFIDKTGCVGQSLIVPVNGFLTWVGYNGIYLWNGRGRPARCSRPISSLFEPDGDLDKAKLYRGYGCQYSQGNQVIWRVSHRTKGVNKLSIKMDVRLTALQIDESLQSSEIDGIFLFDTDANSYFSICSFKPSNHEEMLLVGDDAGYIYQMFGSSSVAVSFDYETKPMDMGHPEILKSFKRVFVYVEKLTDNDLKLFFWADYRIRDEYRSVVRASLAPTKGTQPALWDIALWDQASFDDYYPDISPIEFNLHSDENNSTGTSLKLRFEQLEASAPVRIHGFAIEWAPVEEMSTPTQQVQ